MERYMYRVPAWNGEFRHVAGGWEEYQNLVKVFTSSKNRVRSIRSPSSTRRALSACLLSLIFYPRSSVFK